MIPRRIITTLNLANIVPKIHFTVKEKSSQWEDFLNCAETKRRFSKNDCRGDQ